MKYISIPLFIASFLIGLIYIYLSNPPTRNITIYPTIDNVGKFQYIDRADNCFTFIPNEKKCPFMSNSIKKIPIQV
jgi:hypothetical protein